MHFRREYYDYKLKCSNGTIETHAYLLKCLSDYFVADHKFGVSGVAGNTRNTGNTDNPEEQVIKVTCDAVVMQSILDLVYYGWRDGVTIDSDICGEILATCDYLNVREDIAKVIAEKLLNPTLYKPEDVERAHRQIIKIRPQVLSSPIFLKSKTAYSQKTLCVILNIAEKDPQSASWKAVAELTESLSADILFELFKKHNILFNILVWYYVRDSPAIHIIKKIAPDSDDVRYVYNVLVDALKYDNAKRDQYLFMALNERMVSRNSPKHICLALSKN